MTSPGTAWVLAVMTRTVVVVGSCHAGAKCSRTWRCCAAAYAATSAAVSLASTIRTAKFQTAGSAMIVHPERVDAQDRVQLQEGRGSPRLSQGESRRQG